MLRKKVQKQWQQGHARKEQTEGKTTLKKQEMRGRKKTVNQMGEAM